MRCLALAGLALPVGAEAAAPLAGFELRARSQHFLFYALADADRPDVRRSERFLAHVERELGHRVSGRAPYYVVEHPADVFAATGMYTDGVTSLEDGWILSVHGYHPHEIVHRVAGELGNPGLFFHEGLAVALGERGRVQGQKADDVARRALARHPLDHYMHGFQGPDRIEAYAVAGSFVGHLLRRYQVARLAEFFRACGRTGRPCPEAFARIFGHSFEDAVAEWRRALD